MHTGMPVSNPIISAVAAYEKSLQTHVQWVDCRFALSDPEDGYRRYTGGHIPGAIYLSLDHDLSAPVVPGTTGRHPLPDRDAFARHTARLGLSPQTPTIVYDAEGCPFAARLWWMLTWLGWDSVFVLDGGWASWQRHVPLEREQGPGRRTLPAANAFEATAATINPASGKESVRDRAQPVQVIDREALRQGTYRLADARAPERFSGAQESIDPVAGHIPGAMCTFWKDALRDDGTFRPPHELRSYWVDRPVDICYCGSGVTATHLILQHAIAGLTLPQLYAGSWSEWITDPDAPISLGA